MDAPNRHIMIERVMPSVDGGVHPAKAVLGDTCVVEADVFRDGHEPIRVVLRWKHESAHDWNETTMTDDGNDRWRANFRAEKLGRTDFFVRAWTVTDAPPADVTDSKPFRLLVDPLRARFGAWYELFVRSQGTDPKKVGTFKDAAARLPDVAGLGFDVVYLAPIHPIGRTARKGPNSSLNAGPDDPGSPWAVGNEAGGHTAVDPALGTMKDFDDFVRAAHQNGLEVALDFAPHCSPDHPWVKEHKSWFYIRPDGTIKCHENPPYKYEDVYPLNFDAPDHESLYRALRDVFVFWVEHGVKIFRVDNPHTKPVAFWEWVIREVKRDHPEVIFLGEAFTRPKMMMALSKAGFSQSYTYFIWRNTKAELTEYLTELAAPDVMHFFRPNFFVTTPDVLPKYLQMGGRPMFLSRLALAATLSPAYGIISGFELCENEAMPGTEEYANSEKFQVRVRDWNKPGNIRDAIAKLNRLRRENPALQVLDNVTFLTCANDQILAYVKMTPDRSNTLIAAVNLDPHQPQETTLEIPMDKLGLSWDAPFEVHELMTDTALRWSKAPFVRLDPQTNPFQIFRVRR